MFEKDIAIEALEIDFSEICPFLISGTIQSVSGNLIKALIPNPRLGEILFIEAGGKNIPAKVTAFEEKMIVLTPMASIKAIYPGARIKKGLYKTKITLSTNLLGNIVDGFGRTITQNFSHKKDLEFPEITQETAYNQKHVLEKLPIKSPLFTGISAIDAFLTLGQGQRIIALAEPGIGKSTLLLKIAENSNADLIIIALIGERGREVTELYEEIKSNDAVSKTIIVASTSDEPASVRAEAANTAFRLAEIAAEQGLNVFIAFDSLTRYLRSLRDIGLSAGEIPVRRGYPASVFEEIPKLVERAGNFESGSITCIFTMLDNNEIDEDPFIQEVKGLTDGHIVLSRKIAEKGIYPAIDIRRSLSRLQRRFWGTDTLNRISEIKKIYCDSEDQSDLVMLSQDRDAINKIKSNICQIEKFLTKDEKFIDQSNLTEEIEILFNQLEGS